MEAAFFEGINEEVEFDGDWTPDENELLSLPLTPEGRLMLDAVDANTVATPTMDPAAINGGSVVALFAKSEAGGMDQVLVQNFGARQILVRDGAFIFDGTSFRLFNQPAFAISRNLVAVIDANSMKFKSYANLRRIFRIQLFFQEATDENIEEFADHQSVYIEDIGVLKDACDQTARKMINKIHRLRTLDEHHPQEIVNRAASVGLQIDLNGGSIVFPPDRRELKNLLRFLDDGLYRASLSGFRYIANSKRPVPT